MSRRRAGPAPRASWREAVRGVWRHPLRAALTVAGLAIGIAAVVGTLSLLRAAHALALAAVAREGELEVVRVSSPETTWKEGRRMAVAKRAALDAGDAERFLALVPGLRDAALRVEASLPVRRGATSFSVEVIGADARVLALTSREIVAGRYFDAAEAASGARVAILSSSLGRDLFPEGGAAGAIGGELLVGGQRFTVVGLVRSEINWFGDEEIRTAYVPFRAAVERLGARPADAEVLLAAGSITRLAEVEAAARAVVPHLRPGIGADGYEVESAAEWIGDLEREAEMQATILGGVALLGMVAAASGILNTLVVGVRERTREIGVRRAIGARRGEILAQFLLEAVVLALPGAAIGLGGGVGVAHWLGTMLAAGTDTPELVRVAVSRQEAITALALAVGIAIAAGAWPAWQASRVPPTEALRYE